jgi:HEAT repeat protein
MVLNAKVFVGVDTAGDKQTIVYSSTGTIHGYTFGTPGKKPMFHKINHSTGPNDKAGDEQVAVWTKWLDDKTQLYGREEAAERLGRSGNPNAISSLLKALKDEAPSVRGRAVSGLGNFKDERIKPAFLEALKNETSLRVQNGLIFSIKKLGATPENEKLIQKYSKEVSNSTKETALNGKDYNKRIKAVWEEVRIAGENPDQYEDFTIKMLNSDTSTREEKILALRILEKTHNDKSINALKNALNDKDDYIRTESDWTLKQLEKDSK